MSDKLEGMPSSQRIVDPETGIIDPEWYDFFEELVFGKSDRSVGTILSGLNQAQSDISTAQNDISTAQTELTNTTGKADGLIAGTQEVTDVVISGRGSLSAEQDAQDGNITTAGAASGGLSASASPTSATSSSTGAGTKTTNTVTVTPTGGVAPYTYAWAKKSGDTFTPTFPTAAITAFSASLTLFEFKSAVYTCTVTDSTGGTPLTTTVDVPVSAIETSVPY